MSDDGDINNIARYVASEERESQLRADVEHWKLAWEQSEHTRAALAHTVAVLRSEVTSRNAANVELHEELDYARGRTQDAEQELSEARKEIAKLKIEIALWMDEDRND